MPVGYSACQYRNYLAPPIMLEIGWYSAGAGIWYSPNKWLTAIMSKQTVTHQYQPWSHLTKAALCMHNQAVVG